MASGRAARVLAAVVVAAACRAGAASGTPGLGAASSAEAAVHTASAASALVRRELEEPGLPAAAGAAASADSSARKRRPTGAAPTQQQPIMPDSSLSEPTPAPSPEGGGGSDSDEAKSASTHVALGHHNVVVVEKGEEGAPAAKELTETDKVLMAEEVLHCMQTEPVEVCMERHGTFGVHRLYDEPYENIARHDWGRPEWMAHPQVQRNRIFDMNFPMTHASGSATELGRSSEAGSGSHASAMTQSLDIYQQLRLGVRALDIGIAHSSDTDSTPWVAHGVLNLHLRKALKDVQKFLNTSTKEVVFIFAGKAELSGTEGSTSKLVAEEEDFHNQLPGQSVHEVVQEVLGEYLATHEKLVKGLPPSENMLENPRVDELVDAGARVLYFWEGQQVLCTTLEECKKTPGWQPSTHDYRSFAFGPPMAPGERAKKMPGTGRIFEPLCSAPFWRETALADPGETTEALKAFGKDPTGSFKKHWPHCYPKDASVPPLGMPTVLYEADAYLLASKQVEDNTQAVSSESTPKVLKGNAVGVKTLGERLNFMLLALVMRDRKEADLLSTQFFAVDFIHPIFVHRLVEYNQGLPECGFEVRCLDTGSCFAISRLQYSSDGEDGTCKDHSVAAKELEQRVMEEQDQWPTWKKVALLFSIGLLLKLSVLSAIAFFTPYSMFPRIKITDEFMGLVLPRKNIAGGQQAKPQAEGLLHEEEPAHEEPAKPQQGDAVAPAAPQAARSSPLPQKRADSDSADGAAAAGPDGDVPAAAPPSDEEF